MLFDLDYHTEKAIARGHLQILWPRFSVVSPGKDTHCIKDGKGFTGRGEEPLAMCCKTSDVPG